MKYFLFIVIFSFCTSCVFGQKYLDSSRIHPNLKLVLYPFLFSNQNRWDGSLALGPAFSIAGARIEIQIGILYDVTKYARWTGGQFTNTYIEYHDIVFPFHCNYYFNLSKKVKWFLSCGIIVTEAAVSDLPYSSSIYGLAGAGISYKVAQKIKLNLNIHERFYSWGGGSPGAFFEVAFQWKTRKEKIKDAFDNRPN